MKDINSFKQILDHLSKGLFKNENTKEEIAQIVNEYTHSSLSAKNIFLNQKNLIIKGSVDKTLLFIKKDIILKDIKEKTKLTLTSIVS